MGGIVKSLSLLAEGLAKIVQNITVFTTNANPLGQPLDVPKNTEVNVDGVKVWYFPVQFFKKKFFYSPELRSACYKKINDFDLLHIVSFWGYPGIPARKAAIKHNIPYILSTHGTLNPTYSLRHKTFKKELYLWLFERETLRHAAAIHYTCDLEMQSTHKYNRLTNPFFIVPNPVVINQSNLYPNKEEAKKQLSLRTDSHVISFIGRLHRIKALDVLISAFSQISQVVENSYLLIAGADDGDESRLRQLTNKYGLSNTVRFLGFADEERKRLILGASDLFWLASHGENFGCSAVEAMAARVPVILSENVGICSDVLADNAGIVVSHDPKDVTKNITTLLKNEPLLKIMSKKAFISASKYCQSDVSKQMLLAYQNVIRRFSSESERSFFCF